MQQEACSTAAAAAALVRERWCLHTRAAGLPQLMPLAAALQQHLGTTALLLLTCCWLVRCCWVQRWAALKPEDRLGCLASKQQ